MRKGIAVPPLPPSTHWAGRGAQERNTVLSLFLPPTHAHTPIRPPAVQQCLFFTPKACREALKPEDYSPKQRPGSLPAQAGNSLRRRFPKAQLPPGWHSTFVPMFTSLMVIQPLTTRADREGATQRVPTSREEAGGDYEIPTWCLSCSGQLEQPLLWCDFSSVPEVE